MHLVPSDGPVVRNNLALPLSFSSTLTTSALSLSVSLSLSRSFQVPLSLEERYIRTASDWPWTYRRSIVVFAFERSYLPLSSRARSVHSACTKAGEGMRSIQLFSPAGSRESLYLPTVASLLSPQERPEVLGTSLRCIAPAILAMRPSSVFSGATRTIRARLYFDCKGNWWLAQVWRT